MLEAYIRDRFFNNSRKRGFGSFNELLKCCRIFPTEVGKKGFASFSELFKPSVVEFFQQRLDRLCKLQQTPQVFRKQFTGHLRLYACSRELQSIWFIFNSSQEQAQRLWAVSSELWYCIQNQFFRAFRIQYNGLQLPLHVSREGWSGSAQSPYQAGMPTDPPMVLAVQHPRPPALPSPPRPSPSPPPPPPSSFSRFD